ncbi:class I SAM-dependent methyltransferase [Gimesia aquarii]|nr:class I SAM-dependent methyltransferase [Gimesia aquarii]
MNTITMSAATAAAYLESIHHLILWSGYMTSTVSDHYANHLGPIYSWMVGDFHTASASMSDYFDHIGITTNSSGCAIDLGCGHGVQTIPLAELGLRVVALDTCQHLLDELETKAEGLQIQTVHDDLLTFTNYIHEPIETIVCMGDTLTHLESQDQVFQLIKKAVEALAPNGILCLSFRDYTTNELKGDARFIPVRSDEKRIHTCFLEYQPDFVCVHDILHTKASDGWEMSVSSYSKLRLSPNDVEQAAKDQGLQLINRFEKRGMIYLAFQRNSEENVAQ